MSVPTLPTDSAGDAVLDDLRESERRYRTVFDSIADVIVHIGRDGRLAFVNRAWTDLTGLSLAETLGGDALEHVHPDDRQSAAEHLQAMIAGDGGGAREMRFIAHDGSVRWMEMKGRALFDPDGALAGFTGVAQNVTARRKAEAGARRAAERAEQARHEAERARDEAEQARHEAERASRAKSEFLSRMSHELRTPLNAILGFGQLLELADLAGEDAENVEQILRAGRHLLDLINEVLDVVRIESGAVSLSLEPVDIGEVVIESLDLVRGAAAARGITLRAPARHCDLTATADRQRLKQVLVNLLSNAVKYNTDAGHVIVRCTPLEVQEAPTTPDEDGHGWLRLSVEDTGRGIAAERLQDVFTPFDRLGAEATGIEGSGIGLSVTKALVEALGGRISVASEPGRGTTFSVDLPAGAQAQADPTTISGDDHDNAVPASQATRTVLYIEDNPSNIMLVRKVLGRRPHLRLAVAHDGADGLEEAVRLRPDLVLLDLHLPTLSGEQVLQALRAHSCMQLRSTPVVIVTADATRGTEARLREAGATSFLPKPIDVRALLGILDQRVPTP